MTRLSIPVKRRTASIVSFSEPRGYRGLGVPRTARRRDDALEDRTATFRTGLCPVPPVLFAMRSNATTAERVAVRGVRVEGARVVGSFSAVSSRGRASRSVWVRRLGGQRVEVTVGEEDLPGLRAPQRGKRLAMVQHPRRRII